MVNCFEVAITDLRTHFEEIYESFVVGAGFFESNDYYKLERERYWRSLRLLCELSIPARTRLLEIGGGQLAILFSKLFKDECVVADISDQFISPIKKAGLKFFRYNLMTPQAHEHKEEFDVVVLLEVIEHIPTPPHVVFEHIKGFIRPGDIPFY